jgi:hypothetical protein
LGFAVGALANLESTRLRAKGYTFNLPSVEFVIEHGGEHAGE